MTKITITVEGPPGSGKSTILRFIRNQLYQHIWVYSLKEPKDHTLEVTLNPQRKEALWRSE